MSKVAIYCRLSAEDKNKQQETEESQSIQNQKMMLINYCIQKKWEIYNIYSEEDYTGADRSRPEFNRLLEDASNRKFDIVLCKSQSRFTRELELVEKYIHGLFLEWGIRFIGLVDQADTENIGNKKTRQINGLVNEWYLEDLSDNIRKTLTVRRKEGLHIGSFALYGYEKDPEQKGHLVIDPEAAEVVREIFQLFDLGYGKIYIARELNRRGIPSPSEYKHLKGLNYSNGSTSRRALWQYYMIQDILKNEMYIGNMVQGKVVNASYKSSKKIYKKKEDWIRKEHTHEPIIAPELWERVQKKLQVRAHPAYDGKPGLFAYKAKCKYCGYSMHSAKAHGKRYLRCGTKALKQDSCIGAFISEEELSNAVYQEWKRLIVNYLDKKQVLQSIILPVHFEDLIRRKKKEQEKARQKKKSVNSAMKQLYRDRVTHLVSEEEYISYKQDFMSELEQIEILILVLEEQINKLVQESENRASKQEIMESYIQDPHLNQNIVNYFIDYIEIGKREKRNEKVPVVIHWKF